ncbi:uncharacterized protein LY89DRAFT_572096 [Mollisia scopiformis]|uniref:Autophagy-related protein 14 n=1 Tax=Mollisia scopiformis TaxID=149040 RepID=A0A194XVS5_MOLSC|nr:uncharacterized protein LY89DRAFT_572096 [Mollisia scopiformis]KUJ24323.1 hypothetical protein LY89DRAFT_572096 [Mollisia scopiformis]
MQCDICFRGVGQGEKKIHFLCPTDARNLLYVSRIQNAQVLLENDALDQQINSLLSAEPNDDASKTPRQATADLISGVQAEKEQSVDRTQQIITQADELRAKVESAREELIKKKAHISRRKSDLASVTNGLDARRTRQIEDVEKGIRMTRFKWNQGHATTASSRAFLCGEAAKLYGLKKVRKVHGGPDEYRIGGVGIVDLRAMNTASPAQISTALSHVVHLLMLSTHYLAVRLPAEITLPHRDYPLPTIFALPSSYKHGDVPFPGSTPTPSSNNSPTASKHAEQPRQPHPRPLFIKKPLPILASEDPSGYGLFLEGVTLLAYDIAWLCKSQGVSVGEEGSFEDVCNIGKNLYNLLIDSRPRPSPASRTPSTQTTPTKGGRDTETDGEGKKEPPTSIIGKYSHGTAHSFLGGAEGTDFIRSWKLLKPTSIADKLKSKLLSEVANAEWEVLDENAWAVDDEMGDDGVVVGARKEVAERDRGPSQVGMQSFISMRTVMDAVEMVGDGERKPGTSGWTRLKPR